MSNDTENSIHQPVRTCIVCRKKALRSELLRVVAIKNNNSLFAVIDVEKVLPGRGAWLHASHECFQSPRLQQALGKALRVSAPIEVVALEKKMKERIEMLDKQ
ncbi:MAG: YlxR family protein [Micrococcaceae bacterium]